MALNEMVLACGSVVVELGERQLLVKRGNHQVRVREYCAAGLWRCGSKRCAQSGIANREEAIRIALIFLAEEERYVEYLGEMGWL